MRNYYRKSLIGSESGAILVVVLGILALLTIMAVSFVFSTRQSMRASESYMTSIAAGDIAEVALAHAIAVLEADKIYRTGDPLNENVPVTETYDSLRDSWRSVFSAPVIVEYDVVVVDTGLVAGDEVVNLANGATAEVVAIDTTNKLLYLNSISTARALWYDADLDDSTPDTLKKNPPPDLGIGFEVTAKVSTNIFPAPPTTVIKSDQVDLDGDSEWYINNNVDDDGDGATDEADEAQLGYDAIWHTYYDYREYHDPDTAAVSRYAEPVGRYAVLVQDESSKINVNVSGNIAKIGAGGNVYDKENSGSYDHGSNEGVSTFEISLENGLGTTDINSRKIVLYRHGLPGRVLSGTIVASEAANRIYAAGQGDLASTPLVPATLGASFDDDDDNFNRLLHANDGVDNDGDGDIDETDEGINEPGEFRVLRPYRTGPLDYNQINDNADKIEGTDIDIVDETNEADDQPILVLEQLVDPRGVAIESFLLDPTPPLSEADELGIVDFFIKTNFDGSSDALRERKHFVSTVSRDRNLNVRGELRANLNLMDTIEAFTAINNAAATAVPIGDWDWRVGYRNMQMAANIYDYRDRNHASTRLMDDSGNVFRGVESIRINEVLVRAATNLYEAEPLYDGTYWERASDLPPANPILNLINRRAQNAGSPRGNEDYITHDGDNDTTQVDDSDPQTITLPDPPFTATGGPGLPGEYPFKLRMRVRSDDTQIDDADKGFEVWINDLLINPISKITSVYGNADIDGRWATRDEATGNWYIEEAMVILESGDNEIYFRKAQAANATQDTVDIDWFYFTLEPDCEWIELVNIAGDETDPINVAGWKLVSEYIRDDDPTWDEHYVREYFEVELPDAEIAPVNSTSPPQYEVFVIDKFNDDSGVSATDESADGAISFQSVWGDVFTGDVKENIHQINAAASIHSSWVDFFGNEPFNDDSDDIDIDPTAGETWLNIDVGRISLYDASGNLVDRITYDLGNVAEAFASLQRDHPANSGQRLDRFDNFKRRDYIAQPSNMAPPGGTYSYVDRSVQADGSYNDWKFWSDPKDPPLLGFVGYSPESRGSNGFMSPAEANINHKLDYTKTVETADSRVKNKDFATVGGLAKVPFHNEYLALIGYHEYFDAENDTGLEAGDRIRNTVTEQDGVIVWINTREDYADPRSRSGWMVIRGDFDNPVNTWQDETLVGTLRDLDNFTGFRAEIDSIRPIDTIDMDSMQFYAWLDYPVAADDTDLDVGNIIKNITKTPTETATLVYYDDVADFMIVKGSVSSLVHLWSVNDTIDNSASGGSFSDTILANNPVRREPDVRMLADYFTTAMIDLEAASTDSTTGSPTAVRWPDATADPEVYEIGNSTYEFIWDEDGGVEDGTYSTYMVMNYGDDADDDVAIALGAETVSGGKFTLEVTGAASEQYHFMRAILSPPPQTFGRINVNTASKQVLQGLPAPGAPGIEAVDMAQAIINARNARAIFAIGDVYRAAEFDSNFTPGVFAGISNLITTRSDVYKIIVIGQSGVDVNGNGLIDDDEVTSEKKMEMIYQR